MKGILKVIKKKRNNVIYIYHEGAIRRFHELSEVHVGYLQLVTAFYKSGLNHNLFICIVFTLPKKDFLKPHNKNKFLNFELPLW